MLAEGRKMLAKGRGTLDFGLWGVQCVYAERTIERRTLFIYIYGIYI
jgi:hypothetical protein